MGKSYPEILAFYYPGTTLGVAAGSFRWQRLTGERVDVWTTRSDADAHLVAEADRALRSAEDKTRLHMNVRPRVRVYPTLTAFRNATGEAGDIAGDTRGFTIRLQPNPRESTLQHELLHAVIETSGNATLPRWFREEAVRWLMNESGTRVAALANRYGRETVVSWIARGLPPELRNTTANQPAMHSK